MNASQFFFAGLVLLGIHHYIQYGIEQYRIDKAKQMIATETPKLLERMKQQEIDNFIRRNR